MALTCGIGSKECEGCMDCYSGIEEVVLKCDYCSEDIYAGDSYYDIADSNVCESCMEDCRYTAQGA